MNKIKLQRDSEKLFKQLNKMGQVTDIVYNQVIDEPVYDVVKGEDVYQYDTATTKAYISEYTKSELVNDVRITDSKAVLLSKDFTLVPKIGDIVEYNSTVYTVMSFVANPKKPWVELQLRSA